MVLLMVHHFGIFKFNLINTTVLNIVTSLVVRFVSKGIARNEGGQVLFNSRGTNYQNRALAEPSNGNVSKT